jgi:quinoprotein glucose dehydrogenase
MKRILLPLPLLGVLAVMSYWAPAAPPEEPYRPHIAPASEEARQALGRIQVASGLKVDLFAAEPLLANPVAFAIDGRGRFYVAETFRHGAGVTDIRGHMDWLEEDLASRTVADRLALLKRRVRDNARSYGIEHDRLRLVQDTDGDGKADRATVFADGFKRIEAGIGAGVVVRDGEVWYTCIPALWKLRDTDGDGRADEYKALHEGFGVHVGYLGHDLHGLIFGPDGKLYFSIGDRGLNVKTPGGTLACQDTGCVLRCNPDGSELEVYHYGLRNPQELAFDQYGNLFTGDNNSDAGDQAKWFYLVEGGDSGWRIGYQFETVMGRRGPYMAEELWKPRFEEQATYIVPPIANIGDGPSGLAYYPGVGLPKRYDNHFFLCDFRGGSVNSGVHSFTVEPDGATFKLADHDPRFLRSLLVTDVAFGPDCKLYVSDWVEGWEKPGKGRLYKVWDPDQEKSALVAEVRSLLGGGLAKKGDAELAKLLSHADQRVRQEAQFRLAARGKAALPWFTSVAREGKDRLGRLHAIWGLGQIGRKDAEAYDIVLSLTRDGDGEVRTQAAKVLGDGRVKKARSALIALLKDPEPRVRFYAAQGLGRLGDARAVEPVLAMLRENADGDAYLRHAGVMVLARCTPAEKLAGLAKAPSVGVRRAALLALRRQESPRVAVFLDDADPALVTEAARAINDVPIEEAMPALAALAGRRDLTTFAWYRVLNANFRLGKAENAAAVAKVAARSDVSEALRVEALAELGDWAEPRGRDRVMGLWRPLPKRPADVAVKALRPVLGGVFRGPREVRREAARVAGQLGIREVGPLLFATLKDGKGDVGSRLAALQALHALRDEKLDEAVGLALADREPALRDEARWILANTNPERAIGELKKALAKGTRLEHRGAFATLGEMKGPAPAEMLSTWMDRLLAGKVAPEDRLDVAEAVVRNGSAALKAKLERYYAELDRDKKLGRWRDALVGGDAERGRRIFHSKAEVSCLRCHKVAGEGGEVGPDLGGIGAKQKRDYLLEAVVFPNRQIAEGYDGVLLFLTNGKTVTGVLKSEDAREVKVMTAEGNLVAVPKSKIDERQKGKSAMPEDLTKHLSRKEVRDLVEFLAGLK